MKHKKVMPKTPKQQYQAYDKSLLLQYINQKKEGISNENEVGDVKNIITAFGSNISSVMMYLPEQELGTLHKNLTQENEQIFYDWLHKKYDQILENKGCGAEKRFLFSACAVRDLYQGKFDNIGKGGNYVVALSTILEAKEKEKEKENYEALVKEIGFIPSRIVDNMSKYAIAGFTRICQKVKRTDTFNHKIVKNILENNLENAIAITAEIEGKEISPISSDQEQVLGSWTQKALSSNPRKRSIEEQTEGIDKHYRNKKGCNSHM